MHTHSHVKQNVIIHCITHTFTDAVVMTQSVNEGAPSTSGDSGEGSGSSRSGGPSITIKVQSSDKSIVYSLSKVSTSLSMGEPC